MAHWSEQEEEKLKKLIEDEHSYKEIEKKMDRSYNSLRKKAQRMGLKTKKTSHNGSWSDSEVETLKDLIDKEYNYKQISEKLNRDYNSVKSKCYNLGIKQKRSGQGGNWTELEIDELKELCQQDKSYQDIADEMGKTYHAVNIKCSELSVYPNKQDIGLEVNHDYFEEIDTVNKAYILGFFAADGCIYKNNKKCRVIFHIKDKSLLEKFKQEIDSKQMIQERYGYYKLEIGSSKMFSDLQNLGFTRDKSNNCSYPNINEEFDNHFIRGVFDGDGSAKIRKGTDHLIIDFNGTKSLLDDIKNKVPCRGTKVRKCKGKNLHRVTYHNKEAEKLAQWMYEDHDITLDRKKDICKEYSSRPLNMKEKVA